MLERGKLSRDYILSVIGRTGYTKALFEHHAFSSSRLIAQLLGYYLEHFALRSSTLRQPDLQVGDSLSGNT